MRNQQEKKKNLLKTYLKNRGKFILENVLNDIFSASKFDSKTLVQKA